MIQINPAEPAILSSFILHIILPCQNLATTLPQCNATANSSVCILLIVADVDIVAMIKQR